MSCKLSQLSSVLASALGGYAKLHFLSCAAQHLHSNPQNLKFCLLFFVPIYFFLFSGPSCRSLLLPLLFLSSPALKSVPFTARSAKRSSHVFYDAVFGEEVTDAIHNLPSAPAVSNSFFLSFLNPNYKHLMKVSLPLLMF